MSRTIKGGVHPPEHKELSENASPRVYEAKGELVYPLSQHIGRPAKPVVKKGDHVLVGQRIAEADGFVSACICSSCSGTVKAIEKRRTNAGTYGECIVVDNDGQFTEAPDYGKEVSWETLTNEEIIGKIRDAGIIGMGGAGFPTAVKLMPKNPDAIRHVIVNGAECEPYITCDDQLMRTRADDIVEGLQIVMRLFPNAEGVILIEDNKPEAIAAMTAAVAGHGHVRVVVAKTKYPQGGEKSIISLVTGIYTKVSELPAEAGCIVDNVATVLAIRNAVRFSEPLVRRMVTVTGDAVVNPSNLIVRIGTNAEELIEAAGGIREGVTLEKALFGGPMMGVAVAELSVPIQKGSNALTLLTHDETMDAQREMTACIRCGRCVHVCPMGLMPEMMASAAEKKDYESYEKKFYGLECIQCGSCTYICPAKRPLTQLFKIAKAEIMAEKRARATAEKLKAEAEAAKEPATSGKEEK
ncbi:MAG: electron transport complex subunit RsxC [Eubacteriales bacterium]|jgi:electron transport complex protein RnfC